MEVLNWFITTLIITWDICRISLVILFVFYYLVLTYNLLCIFFQNAFLILCRSNLFHLSFKIDNHMTEEQTSVAYHMIGHKTDVWTALWCGVSPIREKLGCFDSVFQYDNPCIGTNYIKVCYFSLFLGGHTHNKRLSGCTIRGREVSCHYIVKEYSQCRTLWYIYHQCHSYQASMLGLITIWVHLCESCVAIQFSTPIWLWLVCCSTYCYFVFTNTVHLETTCCPISIWMTLNLEHNCWYSVFYS